MKSTLILFISVFTGIINIYSQNSLISLNDQKSSFGEVIQAIEEQSDFKVFYKNENIDLMREVQLANKESDVFDLLASSLEGTNIKYTTLDNIIALSEKEEVRRQQNVVVTGTITNEQSQPLTGVNVVEKGTTNGTVTDIDGNYSITVSGPEATLTISFIGYFTEEIQVGNQTSINMMMKVDMVSLNELVVVGYGTTKRSDLTGSVSGVGTKEIQQQVVQNTLQAMQGRIAGVDISSVNRPGEVGTIRIRGVRSLEGGNEPLYVIDGVPVGHFKHALNTESPIIIQGRRIDEEYEYNPMSDLNPNDIESIEVLKDASATAIYGSRGANGVILITTKKGKSGKTKVSYDFSVSFDQMDDRVEMFDAEQQFAMMREAYRASNSYPSLYPDPRWDYLIIGGKDTYSWESIAMGYEWENEEDRIPVMRPTTPEEQLLWGVDEVPVYNPANVRNIDWVDMAIGTGISTNHQLGFSSGSEKMQTYFSLGYLDQKGIEKGQFYKRYNALVSLNMKLNQRLRIGGSLNGSIGDQDYGPDSYNLARSMLPFAPPYTNEGEVNWLPGGESTIVNWIKDPETVFNNRKSYHILGSFFGEVDIVKGLKYRINFGPDYRQYRDGTFQGVESSNRYPGTSYARYYQNQLFNWALENLLYYNLDIKDMHSIGVTLLLSAEKSVFEDSHVSAEDLPTNEQLWYNIRSARTGVALDYGSDYSSQQRSSFMLRLNYGFMNRYLLTLTGRKDRASVLAPGNKGQFFPSAALAWKIQEEPFFESLTNFMTEAKIRVSWGVTGNSAVSPYTVAGPLRSMNYSFGSSAASGWVIGTPPNSDLMWEETAQKNLGFDLGFFHNRIRASIDLYDAETNNLLMNRSIPVINGSDNVTQNIGVTRNRGIEIQLTTVNISTKDFSWRTDFTFSLNKNEIVELANGATEDILNEWFVGEPIEVSYGYLYDGIWQDTDEENAERLLYGNLYEAPGMIRVQDLDTTGGQYVINSFDRVIRGSAYPKFIIGMTNYITYKGFELSFFIYAKYGHTVVKPTPTLYGRYHDIYVDYWTPLNTTGEYPRPNFSRGIDDPFMSTLRYQDGSFIKVKNISLSYNLPAKWLSKIHIDILTIKAQVLNPFLFTKAVNVDPEYATLLESGINPTKSFVLGLNVGF